MAQCISFPYAEQAHIVEALSLFIESAFRRGDGAVLATSPEHAEAVKARLRDDGFDPDSHAACGQVTFLPLRNWEAEADRVIDYAHGVRRKVRVFGGGAAVLCTYALD